VGRRQLLAVVLVAGFLGLAGYGLRADLAAGQSPAAPDASGTDRTALVANGASASEAVVGERPERVAEATAKERRAPAREGRGLDLAALVALAGTGITALALALARRRHRRATTTTRGLAPSRGPPLLLPS
jgi:hypothetical protein